MDKIVKFPDETQGTPAGGVDEVISASWNRSADCFHIDPSSRRAPSVLSGTELKERQEPLERLAHIASEEINNLYSIVRDAGYVVLLCDSQGIAVDYRGDAKVADEFKYWGIWLGGVWSEDIEGTNGIGTCIEQQRPVSVHLNQHFRSRHTGLSCSGAPIFGPDGSLLAVIDVSAMNPSLSEQAHLLTGPLTISTARSIEERSFRDAFRREWIAAIPDTSGEGMLLAVDDASRIVGADRKARQALGLGADQLREGVSLWRYFNRDMSAFHVNDCADRAVKLSGIADKQAWHALITAPHNHASANLPLPIHTRPREGLLSSILESPPDTPVRRGLGASAIGRVRDFMDAHLSETIDVARLADVAGLSVFHFSREFKKSLGVTPHNYLIMRRIRRARQLLETTSLSLSEIAVASGFADQGHMARYFRRLVGSTPREYRLSR